MNTPDYLALLRQKKQSVTPLEGTAQTAKSPLRSLCSSPLAHIQPEIPVAALAGADATTIDSVVGPLKVGAGDTETVSRWWLIHYLDRDPGEVSCTPDASHDEILERHPDAVAAEPLGPIDPEAWEERAAISEFDGGLTRDAAERLAWREDDRRNCSQCANLVARRCLAAKRGEIVASPNYKPIRDMLKRCEGYAPGADEPDRRHGRERWPGLIHQGEE